jgi:hypothetical protein
MSSPSDSPWCDLHPPLLHSLLILNNLVPLTTESWLQSITSCAEKKPWREEQMQYSADGLLGCDALCTSGRDQRFELHQSSVLRNAGLYRKSTRRFYKNQRCIFTAVKTSNRKYHTVFLLRIPTPKRTFACKGLDTWEHWTDSEKRSRKLRQKASKTYVLPIRWDIGRSQGRVQWRLPGCCAVHFGRRFRGTFCLALMREAARTSETSVSYFTRQYIPEEKIWTSYSPPWEL